MILNHWTTIASVSIGIKVRIIVNYREKKE
ncbi:hypothetical protein DZE46_004080 [Clostridium beijerinckii]|nr:hypothetical protein [Clostridium beijerinckii]NRT26398.1 hypothetical protein [Clostridium beijerinckii]NRU06836.1 hypothetical protein [Clostridium beijerinckii]NRU24267.1 hypothetical protein [Clostridium beijerinckii]NRU32111.1 hypothetical protein [Clostridium beijerinckii]